MSNHQHDWVVSKDQSDTGTRGIRKHCTRCAKRLTFINEELT